MDSPGTQTQAQTKVIALLGRRDEPTDGVQDYCERLAAGLAKQGWSLESVRVPWPQRGWLGALRWLSRTAKPWNGRWVLVQYTALSWSRRAFPLGLLRVLWILRRNGARVVVIFHDAPYEGPRWIDWLRQRFQLFVMHTAYRVSERSVFTMALDKVNWLPAAHQKAIFIPVGANVSPLDDTSQEGAIRERQSQQTILSSLAVPPMAAPQTMVPSLAVFGVTTWRGTQQKEIAAIVHAAREASARLGELRLLVLGRGALEAEQALREGLAGSGVALSVYGVLPSQEVGTRLAECDALLFIRGALSTRRGSGLAALTCGLPIVAYRGEDTAYPLDEGGIVFVPEDDLIALAGEVTRVLADGALRDSLRVRNQVLYREWFSWDSIARRLISSLAES